MGSAGGFIRLFEFMSRLCYKVTAMKEQETYEYIDEQQTVIRINDDTHPLYLIKGEKTFLIDSGLSAKAKKYAAALSECVEDGKIDTLLLTHSHYDHVGACSYLQDIYKFNVLGSRDTAGLLNSSDIIEMIDFQNQEMKDLFSDSSDIQCKMPERLRTAAEGEKINVSADRYFEVIAAPGHSRCSLAYLLLPDRILFPGDSAGMMEKSGRKRPVFFSGFRDYENTLLRLAGTKSVMLAFAHTGYIKGKDRVKDYFDDSLDEARKLKDRIRSALMKSRDMMGIVNDILSQEYIPNSVLGSRENYMMHFLAMSKIIDREFMTANYQ